MGLSSYPEKYSPLKIYRVLGIDANSLDCYSSKFIFLSKEPNNEGFKCSETEDDVFSITVSKDENIPFAELNWFSSLIKAYTDSGRNKDFDDLGEALDELFDLVGTIIGDGFNCNANPNVIRECARSVTSSRCPEASRKLRNFDGSYETAIEMANWIRRSRGNEKCMKAVVESKRVDWIKFKVIIDYILGTGL